MKKSLKIINCAFTKFLQLISYFYIKLKLMKDNSINSPFYIQIQKEINRIERKTKKYILLFYFIRVIQIVFTATITIVSGIGEIEDINKTKIALILGAVATAITAFDTLFQTDNKKNTYKLVLFELRSIRAELVYYYIKNNVIDSTILETLFNK